MTSKVDICNMALAHIRAPGISDLSENSVEARYANIFYPVVRNAMLQSTSWDFARTESALTNVPSIDLFDYVYAYARPSDCLQINYLKSEAAKVSSTSGGVFRPDYYGNDPFVEQYSRQLRVPYGLRNISGVTYIGANEPDLWIDYIALVDNPNRYSPLFITALSWYLAAELAIPIIGGENGRAERQNSWQIYSQMIREAQAYNMNQQDGGMEGGIDQSEFISVRS